MTIIPGLYYKTLGGARRYAVGFLPNREQVILIDDNNVQLLARAEGAK